MNMPVDGALRPDDTPFHAGERALQMRAGVRERMAEIGTRMIRDHLPDQHRAFFAQLPFVVVGSVDHAGQPWASILHGAPGFMHSPDPRRLRIDARPAAGSALGTQLASGGRLGLLGIEPHTRRRNRMNGRVGRIDQDGFLIDVEQSFGNCPKYIRPREALPMDEPSEAGAPELLGALDEQARALIARADTLFIASTHSGTVDVSHRGGYPGFVATDTLGRLLLPDYAGNNFFNTLGNLLLEPRAGLLFIDTDSGDLLQVAATAEIVWDGPEVEATAGALHLVRLTVTGAQRTRRSLPLRWRMADTA